MSRSCVGSAVPALFLAFALFAPAAALAQATNPATSQASAFLPLRGQRRVLFETRDGRLLKAKPIGIFGDSLWLERPVARLTNGRFRLAMADVAHAYVHRKNPRTMALVHGLTGFAGGALVELGLGSRGGGFADGAKHVLVVAGLNGATRAGVGALIGILFPAWTQAVPPPGDARGAAIEPFPAWSATALGDVADPSSEVRGTLRPGLAIASWKEMGPHFSWGYEYGTLSRESFHTHRDARLDTLYFGIYAAPAIDEDFASRWVYSTLQFRVRMLRDGIRPLVTFGFGTYGNGSPFHTVLTDSTGARHESRGRDVVTSFGANAGVGLTWGRGPTRPEVEVRYHGLTSDQHAHWVTAQAGVVFQ